MKYKYSEYQEKLFSEVVRGKGNIAVNAVAGSGKTTSLVESAKRIDGSGVFVAFNNHIVKELGKKLTGTGFTAKTLHSVGYGALARHLGKLTLDNKKIYCCIDNCLAGTIKRNKAFKTALKSLCDLVRNNFVSPEDHSMLEELCEHYGVYVNEYFKKMLFEKVCEVLKVSEALAKENQIDFNDMIYLPVVWGVEVPKSDFVFADECQDFNTSQLSLVMSMGHKNTRFVFVGDPRQAIMGFAGADANSFYNIVERSEAKLMPLSICYRCPRSHVEIAKSIVPQIEASENAIEGEVKSISQADFMKEVKTNDMIISRKTAPLVSWCIKLISKKIPAKVRGRDIGRSLTKIVKEVSGKKGFSYNDFEDFLNDYKKQKVNKMLDNDADGEVITAFEDKCAAVLVCWSSFDSRNDRELTEEIENLFSDENECITLCTAHRAKGLEADRVFILQKEDFPLFWKSQQSWQYEQEMNLLYVAYTRAKQALFFVES